MKQKLFFSILGAVSMLLLFSSSQSFAAGSIKVCKVISDSSGNIVTGSAQSGVTFTEQFYAPAEFEVNHGQCYNGDPWNPDPRYPWCPAAAVPSAAKFTTPLTLNTYLPGFPAGPGGGTSNNARCVTYSNLPIDQGPWNYSGGGVYYVGTYFYKEETISGGNWETPLYNDTITASATIGNLYAYTYRDLDSDASNNSTSASERNANGMIQLSTKDLDNQGDPQNRVLVIFNKIKATSTPTPTPTKTGTPTPTKTGTPTPTKTPTPTPTKTGTPTPSPTTCTPSAVINLNPSTTNASAGQTILFTAQPVSPIISCGNTIRVDFSSSDTTLATMSPTSDSTSPYTSTATVTSNTAASGVATITAKIYIGGVLISSDTAQLTVTAAAVPSCSFTLSPPSISIASGSTQPFTVSSPVVTNGTIDRVDFSIDNPLAASISPLSKSSASYTTTATGITPGSTATITAKMYVGGDITPTCSSTASISINALSAWWQVKNGDAVTNGSILSSIPSSCSSSATCDPHFITSGGAFTFPGVAFGETGVNPGNGSVSSSGWNATSGYDGKPYSYSYFDTKATCGTVYPLGNSSVTLANLISNPATNGYFWNKYTASPVTIASDLLVDNRKIILFVDNDLTIKGNISVNRGTGLFMVFVSGNIIVDPSVTTLSGVYFTNKEFRTGTAGLGLDQPLSITGSVAAFQQIVLERNLTDNSGTPAELFEFAPDFLLQFPSCLGEQNVEWRELAP